MIKHSVTHLGVTMTRNSKSRSYSHVVVEVSTLAEQEAQSLRSATERAAYDFKYAKRHVAEGVEGAMRGQYQSLGRAWHEKHVADCQATVDKGVAGLVAEMMASAASKRPAPNGEGATYVTAHGWSSSRALAEKMASSARRYAAGQVLVLEVGG